MNRTIQRLAIAPAIVVPMFVEFAPAAELAAEPMLEKTVPYETGKDGDALHCVPGIVVTARGIQPENGRLLVPVWLSPGTGGRAHRPSVAAAP